ncbi:hypothetical protein [Noviherbaspirillum pedocola]|nr:hypothetical protein [Noviherbaspirillum pedocola]
MSILLLAGSRPAPSRSLRLLREAGDRLAPAQAPVSALTSGALMKEFS